MEMLRLVFVLFLFHRPDLAGVSLINSSKVYKYDTFIVFLSTLFISIIRIKHSMSVNNLVREAGRISGFVVFLVLLKTFILDFMVVSGISMSPYLSDGEVILVNKTAYGILNPFSDNYIVRCEGIQRGDVVIYPMNGKYVVKRCRGLSGERVEVSSKNGYSLTVNGEVFPLSETEYRHYKGVVSVPSGMFFAVGDNIPYSVDSRDYGFVSLENIRGKVIKLKKK